MIPVLVLLVATCFGMSLLPFLFPGAIIGLFGLLLNHWIGGLFVSALGVAPGLLVSSEPGTSILTLQGVLAFYVPALLLLALVRRR